MEQPYRTSISLHRKELLQNPRENMTHCTCKAENIDIADSLETGSLQTLVH